MELSFSTIRSSATPPNIIAPSRPFPIGDDSVKFVAGASNQMVVSGAGILVSAAGSGKVSASRKPAAKELKTVGLHFIKWRLLVQAQDESAARRQCVFPRS